MQRGGTDGARETDERPRVALVLAGGTIDSLATSRLDLATYYESGRRQSPDELLDSLPELADIAIVETIAFPRVSSSALTGQDWLRLGRLVASLQDTFAGVVVAHGTNTMEETAYFLDLCLSADEPVVLVGAMRPASALSADGALNLLRAVQVAASADARGHGVLIAMNERVFTARDATKVATQWLDAVQAPGAGPIGYVDALGELHMERRRTSRGPRLPIDGLPDLPRVDVVVSYVGADGALIDAAVAAGAQGIVSAGTGAGRPTPLEEEALARAVDRGVVVCRSSRVGSGSVVPTRTLADRGFVAARGLNPWKARVLLALALPRTRAPSEIQRLFDEA